MLKVTDLCKEFKDKVALNDIDLTFPDKGLVIIKGESGSGKTTLLNLLTALDYPTRGKVEFDGVEITPKNSEHFRMKYCGNIYQDYMLLEDLSVNENIELALQACGQQYSPSDVIELLNKVRIPEEYQDKKVSKLSGEEKQRVSIARAIAKRDAMIFADEPTGNLDSKSGKIIMDLLKEISLDRLVVVVSHNEKYNELYADYTVELEDGNVKSINLPNEAENKQKPADFDSKNKIKPRTIARLTFWGFEKNRTKTIVSMIVFVILAIFSVISTVTTLGDANLAYARSLENCKTKNVLINIDGNYLHVNDANFDFDNLNKFRSNIDYESTNIYHFNYDDMIFERDGEVESEIRKLYSRGIYVSQAIIYNPKQGMDIEVLYGDFPKEPNDIMLPYCYANYISKVIIDYKVDKIEDLIGKDFIFAKSRYYESDKEYYKFKICGIFEEGDYYTDYEEKSDENLENFYWQTNMLAKSVILAPQAQEIMFNNAYLFNGGMASFGKFIKFYDLITVNNGRVNPYAYDKYSDYAQQYLPLEKGEVYLDKAFAESKGIKVGDILTDTKLEYYSFNGNEESDFDGVVVKGIFDLPNKKNFIIFSQDDYYDIVVIDDVPRAFWGYYFNAKNVKDYYKFFNDILSEGKKLDIFTVGFLENIYTENIHSTSMVYNIFVAFRNYVFLPAMLLSYLGMLAMGFVSFSYLISAKAKSYNVLRALGFGKKNISLLLFVQIFAVIFIECILGIVLGYLSCNLLGKAIVSFSTGVSLSVASEVVLPMGFIAPIIMVGLSLILGGVIVLTKTRSLFAKSIIENKTS
ncbi:MAG: ATP-binding cassette domain-containing protein [Clostridia bacterium]|nr:ATP-binding cassette domain-containing protein [Clostridia bacterium]